MEITGLFQVLAEIIPLSENLKEALQAIIREKKYPRKSLLLEEGSINRHIYFVKEGFCRGYYYKNGKEYTTWFMGQGNMVISVYSFFTQRPSAETIEILEDCILQYISYQDLQMLYKCFPEFNVVGRILTEKYYILSEERALALRTLSAKDRYENLIKAYPEILQKATLGQIASHLGITQETLSRVRGKYLASTDGAC